MEFNPDTSKQATEVFFSFKKSSPKHLQLMFNGIAVVKASEQNHLGFFLWQGLSE